MTGNEIPQRMFPHPSRLFRAEIRSLSPLFHGFKRSDGWVLLQDVAQLVDAFEQAVLREGVHRELHCAAAGSVRVCDARSTFTGASGFAKSSAWTSRGTTIGSSEFFSEFCLKMSANDVLITARNPYCVSAHGACSRELPQPKLSPASRIWQAFASGLFRMKSGFGVAVGVVAPVAEKLIAQAVLRNGLQESRRDDLVGIDVVDARAGPCGFRTAVNFSITAAPLRRSPRR